MKTISIIVPCFNEASNIGNFYREIIKVFRKNDGYVFEIVCVDDGSVDNTLNELLEVVAKDNRFKVIELSRNFGKEAAITAGIDHSIGDAVIPIDCDLQDPPELIKEMIEKWEKGAEVVLAKRVDRSEDTIFKRKSAEFFYKIHNKLANVSIPNNVGDFRLMDRVVVSSINELRERQRFMKGIFAWVGYKTETIEYVRASRRDGDSKFSGWKLWNLALEGFTSFSTIPLRLWTYIGGIGAIISILYALFILIRTIVYGIEVPGYASLIVIFLFISSLQILSIGLLGEYIGRIYMETKHRPIYVIRRKHGASK
jgi:glycosyltransferase involved in cell wall biosynthesis